jgi:lipoyl-dependent peroxiredoxin
MPTRTAEGKGTHPEELIAAAHAGCFSMDLSGCPVSRTLGGVEVSLEAKLA